MRTVLILVAFVALAVAIVSGKFVKTKPVDKVTVERQYKILELFEAIHQVNPHSEYYKIGKKYDIKANINNYTNNEAVDTFFQYYDKGYYSLDFFTVFNEEMKTEAKYLFDLLYSAKDFDTFYYTAAWARYYINKPLFAYTFYIAAIQRPDMVGLVLPPFYEIWPQFFANLGAFNKIYYTRDHGLPYKQFPEYGLVKEGNEFVIYVNYSHHHNYGYSQDDYKISYFTEDIGWNTYYNYFHSIFPFWQKGNNIAFGPLKEKRGEIYYYFYQQLLARYNLERLTNGLGQIPTFSWYQPFKCGYYPFMIYPFVQRSDEYIMQTEENLEDLRFVRNYESTFLTWLEEGKFEAYNHQVDFRNSKSINFVGNFWQANPDLYEKIPHNNYYRSYEQAARRIIGGSSWSYKEKVFKPSALDFYQTSLRDPAFYQIYNKIFSFIYKYKQYVPHYTQDNLHYVGVKVKNVKVSKLTTFFNLYKFNASNAVYYSDSEFTDANKLSFMIAQLRLNHESFTFKIAVKSDVDEEATVKIFLGPKYDDKGYPVKVEDNWQNFVELDWFKYKLTKGETVIERSSDDFFHFKEDSCSSAQIYKHLTKGELPVDMMEKYNDLPKRLMLPKGTKAGFPLQFFVFIYKSDPLPKEFEPFKDRILDEKPLGYPFDRPVPSYFVQPNMYFKDVEVYHKHDEIPFSINTVDYKH